MRRLLMVAYHFPPVGGVGVERSLKHATYLPDHGWQAVVVAPSNSAYRIMVPDSVHRIPPGVEVHRAPTLEPAHIRQTAGRLLRRGRGLGSAPARGSTSGPPRRRSVLGALYGGANAAWAHVIPKLFFPDEQLLWIPGAVVAGELAHRRSPVDAIYSSGPPVSGHLAAAVLAHRLHVPWIADFRDPWIGNSFASPLPAWQAGAQERLERAIVARASRVLFATAAWRATYARRYPELEHRFIHVPNGYDRADLGERAAHGSEGDERFWLIYAGSIYGDRELTLFLDGLSLSVQRDPGIRERLRVTFVGRLNAHNLAIAEARRPEFAGVVEFLGFQPRSDAIEMERSADAGLILIAGDPGRDAVVPAKLYEYIGLDLPVFAVAPPGETRAMLKELDWGLGIDPIPERIADGLKSLPGLARPNRSADPDGRYDRRALTERLAAILDEVVGG